ncbi:MAG TPA: uridine diphosphate-N-acetylglucosamine-binding protein YvcK [Candidatus Angelobacter sp.]|jgi:uncharacterized cofD-like protein|nr:uridine diphosphate-N-acetylglucosamine-binding protein YvcK [Candidatus Angelobacter sp.]
MQSKPEKIEQAKRGYRLVAIGGGTGLSTLLRGLKRYIVLPGETPPHEPYFSDVTAVVTVSDDGGSSGRLRRELNILPPGDIRNCLVAVSEDETLLSKLFRYRFSSPGDLEGHSFGNLFLAALTAITGDFAEAVKHASQILATRGNVLPATSFNVQLEALMDDGSRITGETNINASLKRIVELYVVPDNPRPLDQTLKAIADADIITMGPGSLFTSLIPNVLVSGIPEAIAASPAIKVFICNLMTEANESLHMTASDHIEAIYRHARHKIFHYAFVNSRPVSPQMLEKYSHEEAEQVEVNALAIEALGVKCITGDFLAEGDFVRHETDRLGKQLLTLVEFARNRNVRISGTTGKMMAHVR